MALGEIAVGGQQEESRGGVRQGGRGVRRGSISSRQTPSQAKARLAEANRQLKKAGEANRLQQKKKELAQRTAGLFVDQ